MKYYSYRVKRIGENFYKLSSVCKKITLEMFPSQLDVLFTIVTIHENFPFLIAYNLKNFSSKKPTYIATYTVILL